jgi:hypothetical protein
MSNSPTILCMLAMAIRLAAALLWEFIDDFSSYPDGSMGEPAWRSGSVGFSTPKGLMVRPKRAFASSQMHRWRRVCCWRWIF